jgi:hypothetical protein
MTVNNKPDDYEADIAEAELQYAWIKLLDDANDAEEFYQSAATLMRRAHELTQEHLNIVADRISKPWTKRRGRPDESERYQEIWIEFYTFVGSVRRGEPIGTPLPTPQAAVENIMKRYNIEKDTAERLYRNAPKKVGSMRSGCGRPQEFP